METWDLGVNEAGLVAFQEGKAGSAKGLRQEHPGCGGTARGLVVGELREVKVGRQLEPRLGT